MARSIYVPQAGGFVNFKDDATDADINTYLTAKYAPKTQAPAPAAPAPSDVGAWESSGYGWLGRLQAAGGGVAELLGSDEYAKWLYEKSQANLDEANKYQPPEDQGAAGWVADTAIQSAPDLAGSLAAAYTGGKIGAKIGSIGGLAGKVAGAGIGSMIGGGIYALGPAFGGNIQRQAQENNTDLMSADEGTALTAAVPQAALDALADRLLIGRLLPNGATPQIARRIVGNKVISEIGKGTVSEGLTEAAQQAIEIGQANPEKLFEFGPEVQSELAQAAFGGAVLGGIFGGVATPIESYIKKREALPAKQLEEDIRKEAEQGAFEQRQAEIAAGANALTQAKPIGQLRLQAAEVSIDPSNPDSPTTMVVNLKAGDKTLHTFNSADSADAAVAEYKRRTNANVQIVTEGPIENALGGIDNSNVKVSEAPPAPTTEISKRIAERNTPFQSTSAKMAMAPTDGVAMSVSPDFTGANPLTPGQTISLGDQPSLSMRLPKRDGQKAAGKFKLPKGASNISAMMPDSITPRPLAQPTTSLDISQLPQATMAAAPQQQLGTLKPTTIELKAPSPAEKTIEAGSPKEVTFEEQIAPDAPREPIDGVSKEVILDEIPYDTVSYDYNARKKVNSSGVSKIIDYSGRKIVVVTINGAKVPFYLSTGSGGKANVAAGKWYPFFGIGRGDGWLNKTSEQDINNYYNSPELRAVAETLDATIGDIRSSDAEPRVGDSGAHIEHINTDVDAAENGAVDTQEKLDRNIASIRERVSGASVPTQIAANAAPATPATQTQELAPAPFKQRLNDPSAVKPRAKRTPIWALTKPEAQQLVTQGGFVDSPVTLGATIIEDPKIAKARAERVQQVATAVENRVKAIAGDKFATKLVGAVKVAGNRFGVARGKFDIVDGNPLIELSSDIYDPNLTVEQMTQRVVETLNHEIIHGLKAGGLFAPNEWRILTKAVRGTTFKDRKYTYFDRAVRTYAPQAAALNLSEADANALFEEEAVAEMFREWAKNPSAVTANVRGLLNRILQLIKRVFHGFKAAEYTDVFKRIEEGEVGAREMTLPGESVQPKYSTAPGLPLSDNLNDRQNRAFGLYPYLRTDAPRYYDHKRLILGATNPGNAATQIANLDQLLARHPNTLASTQAFADYLADAQGSMAKPETGVPIVPYKAVQFANNPTLVAQQLGRLSAGQLSKANDGLAGAQDLRRAYVSGSATPLHTAKLILWGILSRGVSPFVQESMFLDVVAPIGVSNRTGRIQGGIDPFILDAIDGNFDLDAYMDYVRTLKIDGLPGAGTTHNLGAFGKTTLVKLQERVPDGRTLLQYIHDLIADYSLSGKEVRRKFHEVNTGIGINNKVLSFVLLVSGRNDVLVLDRVQMRNQFNDGRFNDYNLYDGEKIERPVLDEAGNPVLDKKGNPKFDAVTDVGTGIAHIGDGVFGLMYYEALERDLAASVRQAYNVLGRGNDFSMGRYHWEVWVATSAQEVDHGSILGLTKDALGENDPYGKVHTGEGKYDTYNSGIKYGYTRDGEPYVALPDGLGRHYYFDPAYAKKVIAGYDKRSTGIISDANFKVSESNEGPWYDRPEVNKANLRRYLDRQQSAYAEQRRSGAQQAVRGAAEGDTNGTGPGPVHVVRRRGGVRQPQVGDVKRTAQAIADKYIPRFSVAPPVNSDEFKRWFGNSAIRNKDGSPRVLYHGTDAKSAFASFNTESSEFGTHFGTVRQANEFATIRGNKDVRRNGRVIPVYLSIQKPLRLVDKGSWGNETVASQLYDLKMIPEEIYDEAVNNWEYDPEVRKKLRDAMRAAGYDGIIYLNRAEGLNEGALNPLQDDELDWQEIPDSKFKAYVPEAEDSFIIFDPRQAKSVFNEFKRGAALSTRYLVSPTHQELPMDEQMQREADAIFSKPPTPQKPSSKIINFFFGGDFGKGKFPEAFKVFIMDQDAQVLRREMEKNAADTGNRQRMNANYSAYAALQWAARASHVAAASLNRGAVSIKKINGDFNSSTVKVEDDPDNIANIIKLLMNGPPDADGRPQSLMDHFRNYAVAKRGHALMERGGKYEKLGLSESFKRKALQKADEIPEIKQAFDMYQRFNKKLMQSALDAEVITKDQFAAYTDDMSYYGFYREMGEDFIAQKGGYKIAGKIGITPLSGSKLGNLASDPMMVMIHNVNFWTNAIMRNVAAQKSFNLLQSMGEAKLLTGAEEPPEGYQPEVMYFRKDGITKRFAVKDFLLTKALGAEDRLNVPRLFELMNVPTNVLRTAVTHDPRFVVTNMIRDTVATWIVRGESITPFIDTVKGFKTALKKEGSYLALEARGIVGSFDESMKDPRKVAQDMKRRLAPRVNSVEDAMTVGFKKVFETLGAWSDASDAATRIPVYEAVLKETGGDEAEAAFRALEVLNFSRRGASQALSLFTKTVPFLNARIQGLGVVAEGFGAGWRAVTGRTLGERDAMLGRRVLVRGLLYSILAVGLERLCEGMEGYDEVDDYIKDGNLLVPLGNGKFLPIAKPFEAGLVFGTIPQRVYRTMTGDVTVREDVEMLWDQVGSTFGVNPIPQAALPLMEVFNNRSYYTGLPIVSEGQSRLDPSLQYNRGTSTLARTLGGLPLSYNFETGSFEGIPPAYIDHLISGYGGAWGTYFLTATDAAVSAVGAGPDRLPTPLSELPGIRSFLIDSKNKNPKAVAEAYELFRIVDETNRTMSRLRKMGDIEAMQAYAEDHAGALRYKPAVMKMVEVLNNLSAMERRIERDNTMTREEKLAQMQHLRDVRVKVTARVKQLSAAIR